MMNMMMNNWNSVIFLKTTESCPDANTIKKMPGVQSLWSTSGDWDWCIQLDQQHSTPEETSQFVSKLKHTNWVARTRTDWWKQVSA